MVFTDLCINGKVMDLPSQGAKNDCEVFHQSGRLVETFMKEIDNSKNLNPKPTARLEHHQWHIYRNGRSKMCWGIHRKQKFLLQTIRWC